MISKEACWVIPNILALFSCWLIDVGKPQAGMSATAPSGLGSSVILYWMAHSLDKMLKPNKRAAELENPYTPTLQFTFVCLIKQGARWRWDGHSNSVKNLQQRKIQNPPGVLIHHETALPLKLTVVVVCQNLFSSNFNSFFWLSCTKTSLGKFTLKKLQTDLPQGGRRDLTLG